MVPPSSCAQEHFVQLFAEKVWFVLFARDCPRAGEIFLAGRFAPSTLRSTACVPAVTLLAHIRSHALVSLYFTQFSHFLDSHLLTRCLDRARAWCDTVLAP